MSGPVRLCELILLCLLALGGCSQPAPSEVANSKARGDRLVAALEAYEATHSRYPDTLVELTPTYINEILPPTIGDKSWGYKATDAGSEYLLYSKGAPTDVQISKRNGSQEWLVDTK